MKPCDIPCPKCGSGDVLRVFFGRGHSLSFAEWYAWKRIVGREIESDVIGNSCNCCQFEWVTEPMGESSDV